MDDLRRRLRETAEAHQPDRDAMLVRIERGMARSERSDGSERSDRVRSFRRRKQASWVKAALAALAVVGVTGLGGLAVAAGIRQWAPPPAPPAVVAPTGNPASATPSPHASSAHAKAPATASPTPSRQPTTTTTTTTTTAAGKAADGPIAARGTVNPRSNTFWEQNDLTIDVAQPLTALTVELRIRQTSGVQNTGNWRTEPPDHFTVTVTPTDGFLVYRWTLNPGQAVPAFQQVFAAQFNHSPGRRDAGGDTFLIEATAAGRTWTVRGGYPPGG